MIRLTSGSWKDVVIEADQRRQRRWILVGNNFVQQWGSSRQTGIDGAACQVGSVNGRL